MTDVCIVGGGRAGLATAIAMRRHGADVTVVDCAVPPVDKACGEGLMPDSIAALQAIGMELPRSAGYGFRGIKFRNNGSALWAEFPNGTGIGGRRTVLHSL